MKGEHLEEDDKSTTTNSTLENTATTNIYPNYTHHPSFLSPPPHLLPPRQYLPHQIQAPENYQITPIKPTPTPPPSKKPKNTPRSTTSSEDGCTIDTKYHPRGRPRGSKNKPKPPVYITQESEPAMSPYILEVSSGADLVTSLTRFTRHRNVGICVFSATGAVKDVTLKQPSNSVQNATVSFNGMFNILSLSACIMLAPNTMPFDWFSIVLACPNGQIIGGKVVGPLVCEGTVYVVATSFNRPTFTRLPLEVEVDVNVGGNNSNQSYCYEMVAGRGTSGGDDWNSSSPVSEGGGKGSGDGSSEVVWAPTPLGSKPPETPY